MKVLLPVYSMADAALILDFVENYHWPESTDFKVIHVLGGMATEEAYLRAKEEADKLLAFVVEQLTKAVSQSHIVSEVLSGDATYEVISAATAWSAAMIVMGYRVRTDIQGQLAGSVSKGVAMEAPCSVAIIRPALKSPSASSSLPEAEKNQDSAHMQRACLGLY